MYLNQVQEKPKRMNREYWLDRVKGNYALCIFLTVSVYVISVPIYRQKDFLEKSRALKHVREISFSIYLVHWPILCSLSCFLYLKLQETNIEKNMVYTIIFIVTVITVAIVAKIFNELVEKRICNKAVAKICERYFEKSI